MSKGLSAPGCSLIYTDLELIEGMGGWGDRKKQAGIAGGLKPSGACFSGLLLLRQQFYKVFRQRM